MKRLYCLLLLAIAFSFSACQKEESKITPDAPAKQPASSKAARVSADKNLYVLLGDNMYRINTTTYASTPLGAGWSGAGPFTLMAYYGNSNSTSNLEIVYVQGGRLQRWNPTTSVNTDLGSGWTGTVAMTNNNYLGVYAVQGGRLWSINVIDGAWSQLGTGDWTGTSFMAKPDQFDIFIVHNSEMYRTQTHNGYTLLERQNMTADNNNKLRVRDFFIKNGRLYRNWSFTSSSSPIGTADWTGAVSMTYAANSLWISKDGTLRRVNPSTGAIIYTLNLANVTWMGSFEAEIY